MRINIVCGEADQGWIYAKFVKEFIKYIKKAGHEVMVNEKNIELYQVIHFIPYYDYERNLTLNKISSAWFSHREESRKDLMHKFDMVAKNVDLVFSQSKKYLDHIIELNCGKDNSNAFQIIPGVDRVYMSTKLPNLNKKIKVGYVGRMYAATDRKNKLFLDKVKKIVNSSDKFEKLICTNGKISEIDMPKFYKEMDIIISTSKIEGGPMSLVESIGYGTAFLCFGGVGMSNEMKNNVGVIVANDENDFIKKLNKFDKCKYNSPDIIKKISSDNRIRSWEQFVGDHIKHWTNCSQALLKNE